MRWLTRPRYSRVEVAALLLTLADLLWRAWTLLVRWRTPSARSGGGDDPSP
jgi:hypothetical protein